MTPEQRILVESRRRQIRYWPVLAVLLALLVAGAYAWLWMAAPVNLSASLVLEQFASKTLGEDELIMLAARGTLALVACGLFMLVIVVLVSVALWNEHRLIRILDVLDPPGRVPATPEPVAAAEPPRDDAPAGPHT